MLRASALALVSSRQIESAPASVGAITAQCVDLMLQALMANEGESVILRAGEVPIMVCKDRTCDLSERPLPRETVERIAAYLLPADHRATLEDVGETRCRLPRLPAFPDEDFTVVAAQPGPEFWMKILRDAASDADWVPSDLFTHPSEE
jgi:hypothetical protein